MQITLLQKANTIIAVIVSNDTIIHTTQDAVELMMNCYYQNADGIILHEYNLPADFFDLKTKLAGDMLQKFSTYNMRLAIIGDFSKYESNSLKDFIYESNKSKRVNFVSTLEEAEAVLT